MAKLSATFHTSANIISPTEATITISTIMYSKLSDSTQYREDVTEIETCYHPTSPRVSVFIKRGLPREGGRFVTPSFPPSRSTLCSRFDEANSLIRLLSKTAAEVAFFNSNGLYEPLAVTGKYFRAKVEGIAQGNTLVKLLVGDARLRFLGSKPGEFVYRTRDISQRIRYTRIEMYTGTDISSGTLIVLIRKIDPFLLPPTRVEVQVGKDSYMLPGTLATNLRKLYWRPSKLEPQYPAYIESLVDFVDSRNYPVLMDDLPLQNYLATLKKQPLTRTIDHLIVAVEVYDLALLDDVLEILGDRINLHLEEGLCAIAARLGFFKVRM